MHLPTVTLQPWVRLHRSVEKHRVPGLVPPVHTPGRSEFGRGNGVKSTSASGIGLVLFGFVLAVNPVNPVSSPEILPLVPNELSGSVRGPKVRCGMALIGLMPFSYWLKSASA